MTTPALGYEKVSFQYPGGENLALSNLTLEIPSQAVTAILGPNGCGKTTLLRLALGKERPQAGQVLLDGKSLKSYSRRDLGRHMGLVPQDESLHYDYSLLEYTVLGRAPHMPPLETPGENDCEIARQALERVGLGGMTMRSVTSLSGGEKQLVLVARALTQQPAMLLLDEPTAHLDLSNKLHFLELLAGLADQGMTIVLTTHEPEVALRVATHLVLMRSGQVRYAGPLEEILTGEHLSEIYHVPVKIVQVDGHRVVVWE